MLDAVCDAVISWENTFAWCELWETTKLIYVYPRSNSGSKFYVYTHPVLLWSAMTTSRSRSPVSRKGESKRRAMARIAELEKQLAERDALVLDMRALVMDKLEIVADLRYRLKRRSSRHPWRPICPFCMKTRTSVETCTWHICTWHTRTWHTCTWHTHGDWMTWHVDVVWWWISN